MYIKALEHWNVKDAGDKDKQLWKNSHTHTIVEYRCMLVKAWGTTFDQEGCGTAYNVTEAADDTVSLAENLVNYVECAIVAES